MRPQFTATLLLAPFHWHAPANALGTRAEVQGEIAAAVKASEAFASRISGNQSEREWAIKDEQLMPDLYRPVAHSSHKRRAEIKAELAEAIRTGDLYHGSTGLKLNQIYPWLYRTEVLKSKTGAPHSTGSTPMGVSRGMVE
jgi:hypothetical protein